MCVCVCVVNGLRRVLKVTCEALWFGSQQIPHFYFKARCLLFFIYFSPVFNFLSFPLFFVTPYELVSLCVCLVSLFFFFHALLSSFNLSFPLVSQFQLFCMFLSLFLYVEEKEKKREVEKKGKKSVLHK